MVTGEEVVVDSEVLEVLEVECQAEVVPVVAGDIIINKLGG